MHGSLPSGVKDGVTAPQAGTRASFFECSQLEPNLARLLPGPEGNKLRIPNLARGDFEFDRFFILMILLKRKYFLMNDIIYISG